MSGSIGISLCKLLRILYVLTKLSYYITELFSVGISLGSLYCSEFTASYIQRLVIKQSQLMTKVIIIIIKMDCKIHAILILSMTYFPLSMINKKE